MSALSILFPLMVTLVIETGLYMVLKHRDLKLFLVVGSMNIILNPTMNIILLMNGDTELKYWLILAIGEVLTTVIESIIVLLFMKIKYLKVLLFAITANMGSFLIGLAFRPVYENKTILIILTIFFLLAYLAIYLVVLISSIKKNIKKES